jgi:hypothetical protein
MIPSIVLPTVLKSLPWKWIGIGVGTAIVLGSVWWQIDSYGDRRHEAGKAEVQSAWDKDAAERFRAYTALQTEYRAKEQTLTETVGTITQEKINAESRTAGLQRRLADSLRKRPERPAGLPDAGSASAAGEAPPKCTGAQLYRDDLEVLRRESGSADELRHALTACYAQYDAARAAVNGK